MSAEHPIKGPEITPEQWKKLALEAKKCRAAWQAEIASGSSNSMRHIVNNLCSPLHPVFFERESSAESRAITQNLVVRNIACLSRYQKLLKKFPEFKRKEKDGGDGCYPQIFKSGKSSVDLISAYEAELKNSKKKSKKS